MHVALTDRFCDRAKAISAQTDYFDETVTGLALRVAPSGRKTWTFHFTSPSNGKRARLTLGTYPATSLAAARTKALEAKGEVEAGSDPRLSVRGAMTIAELIEAYLANHVRRNLRSAKLIEERFNKDVLPVIGTMKVSDLHRRDMTRIIDPIIARGAPIQACSVFKDCFALTRWAVARGDLDHNPFDGLKKPPPSKPRERVLSDDEIRQLWAALPDAFSEIDQKILKLCLITAQRVGEVMGSQRSELDLSRRLWTIPGSRTKNGYPHSVPLTDPALKIIDNLVVDPTQFDIAHRIQRALKRVGIAHWTAHDLRRTALTKMAELGVPPIVLGHIANHRTTTKAGMTLAVYVHHPYEREKREALELWAARLQGIIAGQDNIVPLRAAQ
jgi:integrase